MALTRVQESTQVNSSGSPQTAVCTLSSVSAGNTLFIHFGQTGSGSRTYSVSDDAGGTWAPVVAANNIIIGGSGNQKTAAVWAAQNHPGGATVNITVSHNSATQAFRAAACEYSGFGAAFTVEATDTNNDATSGTSHKCSASGITSAAVEVLAICSAVLNVAKTDCAPGSGYTEAPSAQASVDTLFQYQIFGSGATSEVGAWTHTGTNTNALGAIALLSAAAGGTTLTPAAGALAITGQAPTLKTTLAPAAGSLTITGFAATINVTSTTILTPAGASLTITPKAATLKTTLAPAAASLAITGFAPTLKTTLAPAKASLALTGFAATVAVTNHITLTPAAAVLGLTGFAATVTGGAQAEPAHTIFRAASDPGGSIFRPGSSSGGSLFR